MKRVLLVGSVSCGKTTLCQRLNGAIRQYKKTQTIEVMGQTIDTPGEYLERRSFPGSGDRRGNQDRFGKCGSASDRKRAVGTGGS